ncbi:MAG: hypothetical protein ACRD3D_07115 [Terriglobia bacterium]
MASEDFFSATDQALIETCRREGRCLLTLDLDFSNPLVFRPSEYDRYRSLALASQT